MKLIIVLCLAVLFCINNTANAEKISKETLLTSIDTSLTEIKEIIISPDGKNYAIVAESNDKSFVIHNGKEGKHYDSLYFVAFTDNSEILSYAAKENSKAFAVVNGKECKKYNLFHLDGPFHTPDNKIFYIVEIDVVYKDGIEIQDQKEIESILKQIELLESDEIDKYLKENKIEEKQFWILVIDEKESKRYDYIGFPSFSNDGKRIAYYAQIDNKSFIVVDDKEIETHSYIESKYPNFSPDGKYLAYLEKDSDDKYYLVLDGKQVSNKYEDIYNISFSPDSKRLVCIARNGVNIYLIEKIID